MKSRVEIAMSRTSDGSIRAVLVEADGPHAGGAIELARASLTTGCTQLSLETVQRQATEIYAAACSAIEPAPSIHLVSKVDLTGNRRSLLLVEVSREQSFLIAIPQGIDRLLEDEQTRSAILSLCRSCVEARQIPANHPPKDVDE